MNKLHVDLSDTVTEEAYRQIRTRVVSGRLEPGKRVSQSRLARELGCSTVPVAEAMRRLESEGLLEKRPRKMARVRQLSVEELEGLYLVREGLESVAARLAARRITNEELARLWELNAQFERWYRAGDRVNSGPVDVAIHKTIAQAARCPLLAEELERLLLIERTAGGAAANSQPNDRPNHAGHDPLIRALADRDADHAEFLMKKHIQAGYEDLRYTFPSTHGDPQ